MAYREGNHLSFASLFHYIRPMLFILLFRYPHLMERSQTCYDTTANPRSELPFRCISWSSYAYSRAWEHVHKLVVQTVVESIKQACCACHDNVSEKMWSDVDINLVQ